MKQSTRVLIVHNHKGSWIKDDIKLLGKHFDIETYYYKEDKNRKKLSLLIKKSDIVYIWFASIHALKAVWLAKKYQKKIITVAGGYDTAHIKGYGLPTLWYASWIPKYILKRSGLILTFSNSSKRDIQKIIKDKEIIVSYGFDTTKFYPEGKKEKMVLTVAYLDPVSWKRKGIDELLDAARAIPNIKFIIVGSYHDKVKSSIMHSPSNVLFTGYISDKDLLNYYQKAKVYAQFSFHDGFCSALGEAMLCNCIPVVTDRGSLPEVIGDCGILVKYGIIQQYIDGIKTALSINSGGEQRKWIVKNFSIEHREKVIIQMIDKLINS